MVKWQTPKRGAFRAYRMKTQARTTLARKYKKLNRKVNRLIPESKYSDVVVTGQTFNYTPTTAYVQNLFINMTQGDSDLNQFEGDEIYVKNIRLKSMLYNTTTSLNVVRFVLVCVKNNMEGLITNANIGNLVMESTYSSTLNAINAPLDHDNRHGVQVLYDRKFVLNPRLSTATTATSAMPFDHTFKINKKISFQGGNNLPTKNGLYFFFLSDSASVSYMTYIARINFTDA